MSYRIVYARFESDQIEFLGKPILEYEDAKKELLLQCNKLQIDAYGVYSGDDFRTYIERSVSENGVFGEYETAKVFLLETWNWEEAKKYETTYILKT